MGNIFLVDAGARTHRLDLMPPDDGGDGYCNVLPGYHELLVRGDGVWHGAAFVLAPDGDAALRLDGGKLVDARGVTPPLAERLVDVLRRDLMRARSWQAATSRLERPLAGDGRASDGDRVRRLQAAFVRHAVHHDAAGTGEVATLVGELVQQATAARGSNGDGDGDGDAWLFAEMCHSLAPMVKLVPSLATTLPLEDVIGALSDLGDDLRDADLIGAANALQLAVHG
jgi:hypothetical protein